MARGKNIGEQIADISASKENIKQAIRDTGIDVPAETKLDAVPQYINKMATGQVVDAGLLQGSTKAEIISAAKIAPIVLVGDTGIVSSENITLIKKELSAVKVIVDNVIFRLVIKNDIDGKYIYTSDRTLDGIKFSNAKLEITLETGAYAVTVYKTEELKAVETKVSSIEANIDTVEANLSALDKTVDNHIADKVVHITASEREKWNNKVSCDVQADGADNFILKLEK